MSAGMPDPHTDPRLPVGFEPRMLSFDVYGTLINTPPANRAVFQGILADAKRSDLDPLEFYAFWEGRNIAHYRRAIQDVQGHLPPLPGRGV